MEDAWISPKSRRLSRLPVPVAGFKKTKVTSTFTASPLAATIPRSERTMVIETEGEDYEMMSSPAKIQKSSREAFKLPMSQSRRLTVAPTDCMITSDQPPCEAAQRRYSLAPRQSSLLATPPQRLVNTRQSLAPNPYGMHTEATLRRKSLNADPNRLVVCVRKRPLSSKEAINSQDCVQCDMTHGVVSINAIRTRLDGLSKYEEEHSFRFDKVFDETVDNDQVYEEILSPLVKNAANGGNSTCFAYGQTGSGKTHTMFNDQFGLCYLAGLELFDLAAERHMEVHISFYEIYQGQLMDLLRNKRKIIACEKEGVVNILGLEEEKVGCVEDLMAAVKKGLLTRVTGTTGANAQSSRSHAVLQYTLRPCRSQVFGRISFIDLAGSERGADRATVNRLTKLEGSEINKSLLALKECIRAMDLDSSRIPFRQSKLTMVLRDSFLGNSRTAMIATVSPSSNNVEHSLNTLRYADRMKETQGSADGCGETVVQNDIAPTGKSRLSMWSTQVADYKENVHRTPSPKTSPEAFAKSTWSVEPSSRSQLTQTKSRLKKGLEELIQSINVCTNQDMLELLEEELSGLKGAFSKLS